MFRDISPQMTGLVSNWCNTLLYGITIVTYIVCVYMLIKRRAERSQTATWILFMTSTIQFILATIYVAVALHTLIEGFVQTENIPNAAHLYWTNPASKSQVISNTVYITNSVVGDLILIWRVYMVWGKNIYVCLLPIIITCCTAATGYVSVGKLVGLSRGAGSPSVFEVLNWILSSWCLSIATQLISTVLIAGMIWWHARRFNPVAKPRYVSLIAIIVESGAIYTLSTTFLLAFALLKTQAGAIPAHMVTQIATIVPTVIIIRVELGRDKANDTTGGSDLISEIVFQPMTFCSGEGDASSSVTVSTLLPSDLQKATKYAT